MKANELRLGNLLQDKLTKSFLIVTDLSENAITTKDIDRTNYPLNKWRVAEPIPLTPEILVKAGFAVAFTSDPQSPNASKKYTLGLFKIHQPDEDAPFLYFFSEDYDVRLKYLHQLQNLYFSLTGEELNISL